MGRTRAFALIVAVATIAIAVVSSAATATRGATAPTTFVEEATVFGPVPSTTPPIFLSTALDGDGSTVAVDGGSSPAGVRTFAKTGVRWSAFGQFLPSSSRSGAFLASSSLSCDGSTLVVGGADVWVYVRTSAGWAGGTKLSAPSDSILSGFQAMSCDGTTIAASGTSGLSGMYVPGHSDQGMVVVFARSGGSWAQQAMFDPYPSQDLNGASPGPGGLALSADGTTLIVASPTKPALIYQRTSSGWAKTAELAPPDGELDAGFGIVAALTGDGSTALVGERDGAGGAGVVWIFKRSGSSWVVAGKLTAAKGDRPNGFGEALAVASESGTLLVGDGTGRIWVFERRGSSWVEEGPPLTAPGGGRLFNDMPPQISIAADGGAAAFANDRNSPVVRVYRRRPVVLTPAKWASCAALNRVYPHGLGRAGARDKTRGKPVTNFTRNTALYVAAVKANPRLDPDRDGIACERH